MINQTQGQCSCCFLACSLPLCASLYFTSHHNTPVNPYKFLHTTLAGLGTNTAATH
jgi:hypothetical protein